MVVPYNDDDYKKSRPTLAIPGSQVKKINDQIGLHPGMDGLAELLQDNALAVVLGVGYPNPTESHFRSMDIWQTAAPDDVLTEGWLGKALKGLPGAPSFHLKNGDQKAPLALAGAPVSVPSIATLEDFQLQTAAADGADKKNQRDVIEGSVKPKDGGGLLAVRAENRGRHLRQQPPPPGDRQELPAQGDVPEHAVGRPAEAGRPADRRRPRRPHLLRLHRRLRHARRPGRRRTPT